MIADAAPFVLPQTAVERRRQKTIPVRKATTVFPRFSSNISSQTSYAKRMPAYEYSMSLSRGISFRCHHYRRADNSRPVSFNVSTWEWVYATNLSRLERETREKETGKLHEEEAHSVLITAILLRRLSCYWGKIVSLRMLTNLRLADLRLTTAQQRFTGQNLPFDLYFIVSYCEPQAKVLRPPSSGLMKDARTHTHIHTYIHTYKDKM
jgi:hypothetical protein